MYLKKHAAVGEHMHMYTHIVYSYWENMPFIDCLKVRYCTIMYMYM